VYPVELEQHIRQGKSQDVEFLPSVPAPQECARHAAALANTNGGILILGVEEPARIVGVDEQQARAAVEQAQHHLAPCPEMKVEALAVQGKTVVVVQVAASEELHAAMGGYFCRGTGSAETTRPMNPTEIRLHALKGKTEDAALSRLAKAVADQSRTIEKQGDTINKLNRECEKANSLWMKIAFVVGGIVAGVILKYLVG